LAGAPLGVSHVTTAAGGVHTDRFIIGHRQSPSMSGARTPPARSQQSRQS